MENQKKKKVIVIGAGFSGLSSACYLAKAGFEVLVIEKNKELGGRARIWQKETEFGKFTFDMGPSWYWMPRIFEDFFADFDVQVSDFYDLKKLSIQYRMFLKENLLKSVNLENNNNSQNNSKNPNDLQNLQKLFGQNWVDLPCSYHKIKEMFELIEPGSGAKLDEFVAHGEFTYDKGVQEYMQKPSLSVLEFANFDFLTGVIKAGILQSFGQFVRKNFESPIIRQMLEFPVLFLGATPRDTPKIYTLMAYTCLKEGTFYPDGGFGKVSEALVKLARSLGVKFQTNTIVTKISDQNGKVSGVWVKKS